MASPALEDAPSSSRPTPASPLRTPGSDDEGSLSRFSHDAAVGEAVELRRLHPPASSHRDSEHNTSPYSDSGSDSDDDSVYKRRLQRVGTLSKAYTEEEEAALVHKLDIRLTLLLSVLYLLSFLDRSNIGNARIAGLETDLSLSSSQYDWLLTAFYITYIAFEWMILLYKLIPAHIYISLCVLFWGLVASCQSLVTSFSQLLVLRSALGVAEAAFGPGVPFYMTFFYRRSELAYRVGLQISAAPLATSFASSLAWVIVKLSRNGPIASWRVLFLVEGFPSVLAAVGCWFWIPDSPATAPYLNARERKVAVLRLREEQQHQQQHQSRSTSASGRGIDWTELKHTLTDPKSYLTALMFLSVNVSFASLPVFLPTIIHSMAFSPLASQALSAPPYLVSFVFVLLIGRASDKRPDSRAWFLAGVSLLSAASYAAIAVAGVLHESIGSAGSITIRYVAVYGAAMGLFASVVLIITWSLNNAQSDTGKGAGLTIMNLIGQCGPLVGVHVFPKTDEPLYVRGMVVCAAFMAVGVAGLAIVLRLVLKRRNDKMGFGTHERGHYQMVGSGAKDELGDTDELEQTLIGGERKGGARTGGFRYML